MRWYRAGFYTVHHVDEADVNVRYDHHPKDDTPTRHSHPPPDALSDGPEPSCIQVEEPMLVTRAVHRLWRRAYDNGSVKHLNTAENPP